MSKYVISTFKVPFSTGHLSKPTVTSDHRAAGGEKKGQRMSGHEVLREAPTPQVAIVLPMSQGRLIGTN